MSALGVVWVYEISYWKQRGGTVFILLGPKFKCFFFLFPFLFLKFIQLFSYLLLRQGLVQPRLSLTSSFACLHLPSARITGYAHCDRLPLLLSSISFSTEDSPHSAATVAILTPQTKKHEALDKLRSLPNHLYQQEQRQRRNPKSLPLKGCTT